MDFLNSLLANEPGFEPIVDIEYLDKEQSRFGKEIRGVVYDIHCRTSNGKRFIVEMQNQSQPYFFDRLVYYSTKGIVEQGKRGQNWKYEYLPVYCVSFMNFVHADYPERFRIDVGLCDLCTKKLFSDKLRYIFIQTPLFDKNTPGECVTNFDKWMYNIINMPTMDIMAFVDEKLFDDFEKMAEYAAMCPVDRMAYDANEKAYRDLMGQLEYATMEGEERGRTEATHEMILKMHEQGISLDTIAVVTGLQVSEVKKIIPAQK
jgi:predicted transposase/invertase (TIGR01784 family)